MIAQQSISTSNRCKNSTVGHNSMAALMYILWFMINMITCAHALPLSHQYRLESKLYGYDTICNIDYVSRYTAHRPDILKHSHVITYTQVVRAKGPGAFDKSHISADCSSQHNIVDVFDDMSQLIVTNRDVEHEVHSNSHIMRDIPRLTTDLHGKSSIALSSRVIILVGSDSYVETSKEVLLSTRIDVFYDLLILYVNYIFSRSPVLWDATHPICCMPGAYPSSPTRLHDMGTDHSGTLQSHTAHQRTSPVPSSARISYAWRPLAGNLDTTQTRSAVPGHSALGMNDTYAETSDSTICTNYAWMDLRSLYGNNNPMCVYDKHQKQCLYNINRNELWSHTLMSQHANTADEVIRSPICVNVYQTVPMDYFVNFMFVNTISMNNPTICITFSENVYVNRSFTMVAHKDLSANSFYEYIMDTIINSSSQHGLFDYVTIQGICFLCSPWQPIVSFLEYTEGRCTNATYILLDLAWIVYMQFCVHISSMRYDVLYTFSKSSTMLHNTDPCMTNDAYGHSCMTSFRTRSMTFTLPIIAQQPPYASLVIQVCTGSRTTLLSCRNLNVTYTMFTMKCYCSPCYNETQNSEAHE